MHKTCPFLKETIFEILSNNSAHTLSRNFIHTFLIKSGLEIPNETEVDFQRKKKRNCQMIMMINPTLNQTQKAI